MWDKVAEELDLWHRQRRRALFWWRDDDAVEVTPQLKRLVATATAFNVGVGLSVIPTAATAPLRRFVSQQQRLDVLVHGYAHVNHAPPDHPKREFGGNRNRHDMEQELVRGLSLIRDGFGPHALPVLVPPWNRIAPHLVAQLPRLGYGGLSTWKPRLEKDSVRGFVRVNAHLDVIDWRRGRVPKSERVVSSLLLRKLRWRRAHAARAKEPLGILTHHLLWGPEVELVVSHILRTTREHPAAHWLTARDVFGN